MQSVKAIRFVIVKGRVMEQYKNKSEFYHFGLLPRVCIHTLDIDEYSHMYIPQEVCSCGSKDWIDSKMALSQMNGIPFMFKDVHRCKKCNEVRMANHIGKEE